MSMFIVHGEELEAKRQRGGGREGVAKVAQV